MRIPIIACCALLALLAVPAHGGEGPAPGNWRVEEVRGINAADGVTTTLELSADGGAGGSGGCNTYGGRVEIGPETLDFGLIAATRMLCPGPAMEQEESYLAALETAAAWRMEGPRLLLLDTDGTVLVRLSRFGAAAASIVIPVPGADTVDRQAVTYRCGDRRVAAEYVNAGPVSLALLTMGDEFVVAANVIAGSGARYAGGPYVWWTRGEEASLANLFDGEDAEPTPCTVIPE